MCALRFFVTLWLQPTRLLCPWDSSSKNAGMGCHFHLQEIFPTQGLNLSLLHFPPWQADSSPLSPPGKPIRSDIMTENLNSIWSWKSRYSKSPQDRNYFLGPLSHMECGTFYFPRTAKIFLTKIHEDTISKHLYVPTWHRNKNILTDDFSYVYLWDY